ncbi:MAG TPA: xanthine dehydrogenase family protein molybdopterin-binding subunit [Verrucomicrobiae bacterium]|nr:xanthine dehydrogenase family protein molybdopterin-binding subunit [Verrucomicrobiae bacterium]
MPSWPKKLEVVGQPVRRVDTSVKATGSAKYPSDMQPAGWLYGMIYRAPWPAAKVTRINLEKAKKIPGINAVVAEREGERTVRFYGEELAAVAGTSKQACLDALRAIEVEATPQPFVVKEEIAKNPNSPRVWPDAPNLGEANVREHGDVDKAFADAAAIVEGFFTTPVQIHHPLEPHGNTVSVTDDGTTCWASTQGITSVREGLASYLNVSQDKVRVVTDYMGGGFGSKFGPGVEGGLAARLSQIAGAPVRLMLTRFEQSLAVGNRPSSFQRIKLGASADGKLVAFEMDAFGTAGIGAGRATAGGGGGAGFPAPYIYIVPNIRVKQAHVAINAGQARAFRAPGHPIASFGMESILDELAVKLKMDPVELRLKNDPSEIRRREYTIGAERFGWKEKYKPPGSSAGPVKVGVGCGGATWGGGGRGSHAEAQINPDGSVEVRCGTQDLGTGTRTLVAMVAAEVFGLKPEQITARIGDTQFPPSGASGGSTTAASVCPAIFTTCTSALTELQKRAGIDNVRGDNWKSACRKLGVTPVVAQGRWEEGLSSSGVGGVQFAEVAVDTETGFVKVRKILCVQDCGLIVNKLTCETQAHGGIIMGLGYALYEERVMDSATGVVLNPNFETYKLPNFADVPEIEVVLLDMPERGVIGVGEPVTIPTASAIANAVANALGVRVPSLPITPNRVLAALGKVKPASTAT